MRITMDASSVMTAYSAAFRKLRALEGFDQQAILLAEAGVILKTWAGRTKVAKAETVNLFARYRAGKRAFGATSAGKNEYGITVNTGRRGGEPGLVWFRTDGTTRMTAKGKQAGKPFQLAGHISDSGVFSPSWLHYRKSDFDKINQGAHRYGQELKKILPASLKAVGLARQAVVQIADDLGIDLSRVKGGGGLSDAAIAKARAAMASNGSQYKNGSGSEGGDDTKAFVQLLSRYPLGSKIGMDLTLLAVVAGRAKYIETAYQKGAFDSLNRTMKAFPNVFAQVPLTTPVLTE